MIYIFDIDGTLADNTHRLHHIQKTPKDYDAFYAGIPDDKPIPTICSVFEQLCLNESNEVVVITVRPERARYITEDWLNMHAGYFSWMEMRQDGNHYPDHVIKQEIYDTHLKDRKNEIACVFEDRQQCVDMWRANGLTCCQVAKGDF